MWHRKKVCSKIAEDPTSIEKASYTHGAHGVVVSHPLSMREALGSIPSVSTFEDLGNFLQTLPDTWHPQVSLITGLYSSVAERQSCKLKVPSSILGGG